MFTVKKFFLIFIILSVFGTLNCFSQNEVQKNNELITRVSNKDSASTKKKIIPIVIPITEPAVGYGFVAGAMYFLPKKNPKLQSDMIVGAAGLTTNGTWFGGGGYLGFWKNDNLRYTGFTGYGQVTMDYYGFGEDNPIQFDQNVFVFLQQMNFRIGESDFFLGGKYQLTQIKIDQKNLDDVNSDDFSLLNSGLSFITEFDNLNNFLSPTKGTIIHLSYDQNLKILGSNRDWGTLNFFSHFFYPVNDYWIPSLRLASQLSAGNPPFYAFPYVELRGVAALRYQGKLTMVAETEQLINFGKRWGAVAFTGIGAAFKSIDNLKNEDLVWNVGVGARYLVSESLGVKLGADIARGPEEYAFYISIGSAW